MKNILLKIALVVVLLLCAAALASCGANTDDPYAPPTGMISATDEKADFCLFVPDEWQIDYSTAAAGALCQGLSGKSLPFSGPYNERCLDFESDSDRPIKFTCRVGQ